MVRSRWPALSLALAREGEGGVGHRETGRLVAFTDAVFAITITLLVLEIWGPM